MQLSLRQLLSLAAVTVTIFTMASACSEHEPGDYQGGGRTVPTSVIGPAAGGPVTVDSSFDDVTIPDTGVPTDAETLPDISVD